MEPQLLLSKIGRQNRMVFWKLQGQRYILADSTADSEIPSSVYQNRQTFCLTILKTEFGISELTEDTVSVFLPKCTSDHVVFKITFDFDGQFF